MSDTRGQVSSASARSHDRVPPRFGRQGRELRRSSWRDSRPPRNQSPAAPGPYIACMALPPLPIMSCGRASRVGVAARDRLARASPAACLVSGKPKPKGEVASRVRLRTPHGMGSNARVPRHREPLRREEGAVSPKAPSIPLRHCVRCAGRSEHGDRRQNGRCGRASWRGRGKTH